MKPILTLFFFFVILAPCKSQSPALDSTFYYMYAELIGTQKLLSTKVTVAIDFGQDRKWFSNNLIVDPATGKEIIFNSMVDAMNFMGAEGWEFVQAYVVTTGNQNVYRWLLKRACRLNENGEYIPLTKAEYKKSQKAVGAGN